MSHAPDLTIVPSTSQGATDGGEVQDKLVIDIPELDDDDDDDDDDMPDTEGIEQGEQPPSPEITVPQVRRSTREHRPSVRYFSSEYILLIDEGEPKNFQEVQTHKDRCSWV